MFCCSVVGNLQVRLAHFTLAALGVSPFPALFTHLCPVWPAGKYFTLLLRHWRKHSVHACAYFGPSRSHACSLGAIFNHPCRRMGYEFCLSDSWSAVTLTRSWGTSRNGRQVMSAVFLHGGYISANPFSYQCGNGQICFITLRQATATECFCHRGGICFLVWNFLLCRVILHNRSAECVTVLRMALSVMPCTALVLPAA